MLVATRRASRIFLCSASFLSRSPSTSISSISKASPELVLEGPVSRSAVLRTLAAPWAAIQRRGAKVLGSDVRTGNVIQRKGRIYQVIKAQHTQHGRGGATIQVELRDVDTGSKITERFRTDESLEVVFVEDMSLTFLYQEGDTVTLMDPSTFEQLDVSKELFGKNYSYLKEDMNVTVQCYDGKPMSASVPQRVTCTVVQAQPHTKGLTAAPHLSGGANMMFQTGCLFKSRSAYEAQGFRYKRVVLDNGLTVMAPHFIEVGDEIVLNTTEDKYLGRAKED